MTAAPASRFVEAPPGEPLVVFGEQHPHYSTPTPAGEWQSQSVARRVSSQRLKTLEEITYEAGRDALADQESVVAGIRQRTGTLLAAQALVASFLGGTAIRDGGFGAWEWLAVAALVTGLVISAAVLAPWELKFAVDARDLYGELYPQASAEADAETLSWLAAAGFGYQDLRVENAPKVQRMSRLSGALGVLMVAQTLLWLTALGVD